MDREIIERLAIDHALGELDADMAALFDAYLAEHAEARTWAEPMSTTCTRTREVISQRTSSCSFDSQSRDAVRRWPVSINGWVLGRWAAVIVIAFGIGVRLGRRPAPVTPPTRPVVVRAEASPSPKSWNRILSESEDGFWQGKALAVTQSKSYTTPRPPRPARGFWDRSRQFRKERSYD